MAFLVVAATLSGCGSNPVWKRQLFGFAIPDGPPASTSRTNIVALSKVTISPLFQSQSFTYRTTDNAYEQDAYASFVIPPARALAESIRAWMRQGGAFGRVIEPGSGLAPSVMAEATINELDGDFRVPARPMGAMTIHFVVYEVGTDDPGRILMDKTYSRQTPLEKRTPAALAVAWDKDLLEIMAEINSDYARTDLTGH